MKKLSFAVGIFLLITNSIAAQTSQLMIKKGKGVLHIEHSVVPKEGLFAIGRAYNVSPRTIAAYNNMDMSKGLSIGQIILIPLTDTNFSQKANKGKPIYYKAGDKETLQKISTANNKVALQKLRDWNKLTNDNVKAGTKVIVGYLVATGPATPTTTTTASVPVKEEPQKKKEDKPVVKAETPKEKQVIKNDEPKEKLIVKKEEPKKEEPKKTEPVVTRPPVTTDMAVQGYFKSSFDQQVRAIPVSKTETVTSGIFKTTSGMQDAKYYLLADGVPSGTIVRVINPDNNKAIYAKVLGEMEGTRPNQGLNIRISNVAASSLGIADTDKFIVKINY